MIKLAVTEDAGEHHVWAMLDDADHNDRPEDRGESFVIASGHTIFVALDLAQKELERAARDIEVMAWDAIQKARQEKGPK